MLDLKAPEVKEIVYRLVPRVDVVHVREAGMPATPTAMSLHW